MSFLSVGRALSVGFLRIQCEKGSEKYAVTKTISSLTVHVKD